MLVALALALLTASNVLLPPLHSSFSALLTSNFLLALCSAVTFTVVPAVAALVATSCIATAVCGNNIVLPIKLANCMEAAAVIWQPLQLLWCVDDDGGVEGVVDACIGRADVVVVVATGGGGGGDIVAAASAAHGIACGCMMCKCCCCCWCCCPCACCKNRLPQHLYMERIDISGSSTSHNSLFTLGAGLCVGGVAALVNARAGV